MAQAIWTSRIFQFEETIATENIVKGFDFDVTKETVFCEPCAEGKQHRCTFNTSSERRADKVLGLVHSDVCGKMGTESLSGGQYFVTFIDDKSRYVWIYILKRQRWQQVIFCKSKSSHKSFPCKSKSFPCKSKSSHKSFGQTSSQVKSQVIWSKHKSSHKSLCPSTSQVAHYFVQL